jgi:hypothetical protein
MDDPIGSAREFVQEQAVELVDDMAFRFDDAVLGREMLFAVTDKLSTPLGMKPYLNHLSLEALRFSWSRYLPNWVNYVIRSTPKRRLKGLFSVSGLSGFVDLSALEFLVYSIEGRSPSMVARAVREQIPKNRVVQIPFPIGLRNLPLLHVDRLATSLIEAGETRLERLYTPFNFNRRAGLISNWWTRRQFISNLKMFYDELPRLFSHVVERNFPGLRNDLGYFDNFDRRIIVIDDGDGSKGFRFRFCDLRGGNAKRIDVYSAGDGIALPGASQRSIKIDGVRYEVRRTGGANGLFMFHPLPLLNTIKEELKDRIPQLPVLCQAPRKPLPLGPGSVISITVR